MNDEVFVMELTIPNDKVNNEETKSVSKLVDTSVS